MVRNLYYREKSFPTEKPTYVFSSFKFLICDFSQKLMDPNPNPNFFSDSDPAKIFGLFRIHNTGIYTVTTLFFNVCMMSRYVYPATILPAYIILFLSIILAARQAGASFHSVKKVLTGIQIIPSSGFLTVCFNFNLS
jgi:hypothetical protein